MHNRTIQDELNEMYLKAQKKQKKGKRNMLIIGSFILYWAVALASSLIFPELILDVMLTAIIFSLLTATVFIILNNKKGS